MIPAAPSHDGTIAFQPPPGWDVPHGFDPRRGHLADPAWPGAPDGWQFWGPAQRPTGFLPWVRRVGWGPLLLGSLATLVVVAVATADDSVASQSPADGIGSCWAADAGQTARFHPVDCASEDAQFRVVSEVTSPEECGATSQGYFEVGDRVQCLGLAP